MSAHIDKDGNLATDRNGIRKNLYCPWTNVATASPIHCGDWCPLFEEDPADGGTLLVLHCGGETVIHAIVSDERK
jgi:hypothetical protein